MDCQSWSNPLQWGRVSVVGVWIFPGTTQFTWIASIFTSIANLLLYGWMVSTTGQFTCNIKGLSNILGRIRCCRLQPLLTASALLRNGISGILRAHTHVIIHASFWLILWGWLNPPNPVDLPQALGPRPLRLSDRTLCLHCVGNCFALIAFTDLPTRVHY